MLFDGFDYMIVAYTMPQMAAEWGLSKIQTGSLTSWSLIGLIIGGCFAGLVSDKIGRRKTLILAVFIYSVLTIPIFFVHSFEVFAIVRILTGIGLGGCIPLAATLNTEYAPTKSRAIFVTLAMAWMFTGWVVAGLVATYVVPNFGWRYCYLIGGIPLLYSIFLYFQLPESIYWLVSKDRKEEAVKYIQNMEKTAIGFFRERDPESLIAPTPPPTVGPKALFTSKYLMTTIGIWIVALCGTMVVYGIQAWLPSLLLQRGMTLTGSYMLSTIQNIAMVVSVVLCGYTSEKLGRKNTLVFSFALCIVGLIFLGTTNTAGLFIIAVVFNGFAMNYAMTSIQPVMVESYPTEFRSTGAAFGGAFGRFGGVFSTIFAGLLIGLGFSFSSLILSFAIPAVCALLAGIFLIKKETKGTTADSDETAQIMDPVEAA